MLIGARTAAWSANNPMKGYTIVKSLISQDNTAYVNTGVYFNGTGLFFHTDRIETAQTSGQCFFGGTSYSKDYKNYGFCSGTYSTWNNLYVRFPGMSNRFSYTGFVHPCDITYGVDSSCKFKAKWLDKYYEFDISDTYVDNVLYESPNASFCVFGRMQEAPAKCVIGAFDLREGIEDSSRKLFIGIPCVRDSDGVCGYFDEITKMFFPGTASVAVHEYL